MIKNFSTICTAVLVAFVMVFSVSVSAQAKTWKLAVGDAAGSAQEQTGKKFAEIVEQKTNGKYKLSLFLNGQLGSEQDTVNEAAMGTLDFSLTLKSQLQPLKI